MPQNFPRILWDNKLRSGSIDYPFATAPGFELVNAIDWRDFTEFRQNPSFAWSWILWTNDTGAPVTFTQFAVWAGTVDGSNLDMQVSVHQTSHLDPALGLVGLSGARERMLWLNVAAPIIIPNGGVLVIAFLNFGSQFYIRQIAGGTPMPMDIGQYRDMPPPNLTSNLIIDNVIAINGSVIGRNVQRADSTLDLEYTPVSPEWVRNTWEPFAIHCSRYAFFYGWNPAQYPNELVFATAEKINPPRNTTPDPKMTVSMPIKCLKAAV